MPEQTDRRPRSEAGPTGHQPGRRPNRAVLVFLLLTVAGGAAAIALFQPWKLLTQSTVSEALPTAPAASAPPSARSSAAPSAAPSATQTAAPARSTPPAGPVELSRGELAGQAHQTRGTVRVLQLADGSRVLRVEGLATSDGPDVKVWLTDAPATGDGGAVDDGRYLDLGRLKATRGDQNYPIPADADLATLRTVSIWCDRFNVSFGAAALTLAG
jgi:Electron transfer DM13